MHLNSWLAHHPWVLAAAIGAVIAAVIEWDERRRRRR